MLLLQLKTNRHLLLSIITSSIICLAHSAQATDFESVYQSALNKSYELRKTTAQADEAIAKAKSSNANFMPKAGVESRYESFDSKNNQDDGGSTNVFLEWNVFNGFRDVQERKGLQAEAQAATLEKQRLQMNFKWIAMAKYTKAQVMLESVDTYKKVIQSNLKNLETVRMRRSSGRLSEADYLEFELFDSNLKQSLISLEAQAAAAVADLESFSGLSPLNQLTTLLKPKPLNLEVIKIKDPLESSRSKLQDSKLRMEAAESRNSLSIAEYLPEINLKATHGDLGIRETDDAPETTVGIVARWELFSGFETVNSRRVSSAQLVKAKAEYDYAKVQQRSRMEQLTLQLKGILDRLELEEKNKKNVDRFLQTVQEEYRRGSKNSNDLKSALELVLETQLNRASLRSDYFSARAELQEILGFELSEL